MVSSKEIRKLLKIREIRNLTDKQAQKTEFFKRLTKRSYRRVKGYIDYKQIATDFAGHLMCLETFLERVMSQRISSDMMSGKSPIIKRLVQTTRKNWLNHVQNQAGQ